MRIIGFNFNKVSAERSANFKPASDRNTNIEFTDLAKEITEITKSDAETLKLSFQFSVVYSDKGKKEPKTGDVVLSGFIILLASKEESKELQKAWDKKTVSDTFSVPIFNFILKKCSVRALQLEEELNMPLHVPIPQLRVEAADNKGKK